MTKRRRRLRDALSWRRAVVWVGFLVLVGVGAVVAYLSLPYQGQADLTQAVQDDPGVTITETGEAYVIRDADPGPEAVGVVFYPEARDRLADVVVPWIRAHAEAPPAKRPQITWAVPITPRASG